MEIVINDTNIFLDLYDIGLLDDFFQLPIRVHTVDFVINEITHPDQQKVIQQLISKGILCEGLSCNKYSQSISVQYRVWWKSDFNRFYCYLLCPNT